MLGVYIIYRTISHWVVTTGRNWWSTQYPPIELSLLVRIMGEEEEEEKELEEVEEEEKELDEVGKEVKELEEVGKEEKELEEVGKEEVERWKRQT